MYPGQTETPQRNWDDFSVEFHFLDEREKVRTTGKLFDRPTQHVKPTKQTSKRAKAYGMLILIAKKQNKSMLRAGD